MALGIIEPSTQHVPGTVYVSAERVRDAERLRTDTTSKRDKTGKIILVPQPSDDPNDPLTWPLWKRDLTLLTLSIVTVIATTSAPLLAADTVQIATIFKHNFQEGAWLTAYLLAGVAVGAVIVVPSARVWGTRHAFLFGALLMMIASAWGGSTHKNKNYASLLWSRVFQGVALAPFESLVNVVVGDLYFVHERGPRMAFVNTALFGGAFLTPVFVGNIAKHLGFQWSFYFLAIFMGVGFLVLFFFVPETAFRRDARFNTDIMANQTRSDLGSQTPSSEQDYTEEKAITTSTAPAETRTPTKDPYMKRLLLFNGRKTDESFWKMLLRPFPLFLHPAIVWGCLMQGVIIGWTVMVGVVLSFIFLSPPLFFDEERAGYMYTSAFIGAIIGLVLSALYTEFTTRWLIKLNKGKYEPEFRILLAIPTLIFTAVGLYGFGITANNTYKYGWLIPDVFLAFIIISMVMGAVTSAQYLLDAHRDMSVELFTTLIIFKNIFSFILAYKSYDWIFSIGIREMFIIFGSIEVAICCLSLPMYVLGKKNRAFFHKHDLIRLAGLR